MLEPGGRVVFLFPMFHAESEIIRKRKAGGGGGARGGDPAAEGASRVREERLRVVLDLEHKFPTLDFKFACSQHFKAMQRVCVCLVKNASS